MARRGIDSLDRKDSRNYRLNRQRIFISCKGSVGKLGIFLKGFDIRITGVYTKPHLCGFDFDCKRPQELLALARGKAKATLNVDKRTW
jgi:hypothetical protein